MRDQDLLGWENEFVRRPWANPHRRQALWQSPDGCHPAYVCGSTTGANPANKIQSKATQSNHPIAFTVFQAFNKLTVSRRVFTRSFLSYCLSLVLALRNFRQGSRFGELRSTARISGDKSELAFLRRMRWRYNTPTENRVNPHVIFRLLRSELLPCQKLTRPLESVEGLVL